MTDCVFDLTTNTAEETAGLAARIGRLLHAPAVLCLDGPVGAGKTHFSRALIQSLLDVPEDVPSPTFTLVQTYDSIKGPIWHADLYRLSSPDEIEELGLTEAFDTAICLVEWPDRLGALHPKSALTLSFTPGEATDQRHIRGQCADPAVWHQLKGELVDV